MKRSKKTTKAKSKAKPAKSAARTRPPAKAGGGAAPKKAAKKSAGGPPSGFGWITPYLHVVDVKKSLDFYERAFGFKAQNVMHGPDGSIGHAEVVYQGARFMLGPACAEIGTKAPAALRGTPFLMYVYTGDVDKLVERAKAAGVQMITPPRDMFWGDRISDLEDPEGHRWTFAQHLRKPTPKEMAEAMQKMAAEQSHAHEHAHGDESHAHAHDHAHEHGHGEHGHDHAHGGNGHGHAHDHGHGHEHAHDEHAHGHEHE